MKQNIRKWFQSEWLWMLFIALLTTISSEIKLSPFSGENFRFGMGTITFLFLLFIRPLKSYLMTGIVTMVVVTIFRIVIQSGFGNLSLAESLIENYPGGIYYIVYAMLFQLMRLPQFLQSPLLLGLLATIVEITSNSVEHILRMLLIPTIENRMEDWMLLIVVALFRSFFVVGIYSIISLMEQKKRLEEQLKVSSGLSLEILYLEKSMQHIESIMADSHELYRILKQDNNPASKKALYIAQEIHEVKKDSQRIYSSLVEIAPMEKNQYYYLSEVMQLVVEGNEKYAHHLNKEITIKLKQNVDFIVGNQMLLMAILNNITANAIESIDYMGEVRLKIVENLDKIEIEIEDSGKGIDDDDLALIFEAGFTTKFNDKGVAATGIGLSHVQEVINIMAGSLDVHSVKGEGTLFKIQIPRMKMEQKGGF